MRILALDPSLVNLGYAYTHIINGKLVVECSGTFQTDKFLNANNLFGVGNKTTNRQLAVKFFIDMAIKSFKPIGIVGETSFYNGSNPSTIINQSKGLGLIEMVCRKYLSDIDSPFELVLYQPNVIKSTLGLDKSEYKDKSKIDEHLFKRMEEGSISYIHDMHHPDKQLDHANDAVAMAFTMATNIRLIDLIET